jgi:hypothetical protein
MQSYGGDYNQFTQGIISDLKNLQDAITEGKTLDDLYDQLEDLNQGIIEGLSMNMRDMLTSLDTMERAIKDAALYIYQGLVGGTYIDPPPGFASGGHHSGGWRTVGENGPELEFTGPSRIASNEESVDMIAAAVSKALSGSNTNGPIHITLNVDRRQIGKVVIDEMRHNPEFGRQMTKQLKVA